MLDRIHPSTSAHDNVGSLARPLRSGLADPILLLARILIGYIFLLSDRCKRRSNNPSLKRPGIPVAPE